MRTSLLRFLVILAFGGLGSQAALAGRADWTAHMNAQNAYCDAQRRGEAPRDPDMCLPSLPPDAYSERPINR